MNVNMLGWVLVGVLAPFSAGLVLVLYLASTGLELLVAKLTADEPEPAPEPVAPRWVHLDGEGLPYSGWVDAWLKPGDELNNGAHVPAEEFGVRLVDGVEIWDLPEEVALLGDAMAARFGSPMVQAVADLADAVEQSLPGLSLGFGSLTCTEVNLMAQMFAQFGHLHAATVVIAGHALEDDCDETHYYIRVLAESESAAARDEAAEVYVRRLMGGEAQPHACDAKLAELEDLRLLTAHGTTLDDAAADRAVRQSEIKRMVQLERELGIAPATSTVASDLS